jgi:hypothetical protein
MGAMGPRIAIEFYGREMNFEVVEVAGCFHNPLDSARLLTDPALSISWLSEAQARPWTAVRCHMHLVATLV